MDAELEPAFQKGADAGHHPLGRPFAPDQDHEVVRVARERMTALIQHPVEVVQDDVGQQGQERPALGHALPRGFDVSVHPDARPQVTADQPQQRLDSEKPGSHIGPSTWRMPC
jgi:hypothetical protein